MQKRGIEYYFRKIAQGIVISLIVLLAIIFINRETLMSQLYLYESMPCYDITRNMQTVFKFGSEADAVVAVDQAITEVKDAKETPDVQGVEAMSPQTPEDIIGMDEITYQPEADSTNIDNHFPVQPYTEEELEKMHDMDYLRSQFYIVDSRTRMTPDLFDVDKFLATDLRVSPSTGDEPKVLIFHTHSSEIYADSVDKSEGVVGVGSELARVLQEKYGIASIHVEESFDKVDGKSQILGAYERMEPEIEKILAENPSIEIVIDLHRDGVQEGTHLVSDVNGKPTAQIMFFNGLTKVMKDGVLTDIENLPNPYLDTNLAFSFQMQLAAQQMYPNFTRKVYLNAYRYSLHMKPKSLLVEVGAQTNTKQEAFNAAEPLADILAEVILPKSNDN